MDDPLSLTVKNNIDILMISETKLDDSFPTAQFLLHGFSAPYRPDRNSKGGGILLYIGRIENLGFLTVNLKLVLKLFLLKLI